MNGPIHEVPRSRPAGAKRAGIAFEQVAEDDRWEVWMLPLDGIRKPYAYLQTPSNQRMPAFSPDGHWLAYASDESGRFEVYVQRFAGSWRRDNGVHRRRQRIDYYQACMLTSTD
jgi:Tol biopolymer transport system component